jgi:hypothetical protein
MVRINGDKYANNTFLGLSLKPVGYELSKLFLILIFPILQYYKAK